MKIQILCIVAILNIGPIVYTGWSQPQQANNNESLEPMYMLTYDHGGLILWGAEHFRERLRNAIEWLDRYPDFKIGLDNEAQVYDYLVEHEPELIQELQGYLEKYVGRFGIGTCTYGQPLSTFISEESNIRQIKYALEANQKYFGYKNTIYLMSEHANHAQMPQLLIGFGFEGAIMRTHFMMYGYNPTFNSPFGWWIGLDGSKIPTVPTYDGEGSEFGKTPIDNWILTRYPGPECDISLDDFRKQFAHIDPLLATRADDSGLRREDLLKEYSGNPNFRWILLDELMDLYPEPEDEFITTPNDFVVRMPWGYCGNEIWNTSREAEVQVLTAERLSAFEYLLGGNNYEEQLETAWKHLLLAQHHDVQIVGLLPDARTHIPASYEISKQVLDGALAFAAKHMKSEGFKQVTVFNPVSWNRTQWIETNVVLGKGDAKAITVYRGDEIVPTVVLDAHRFSDGSILEGHIAFLATLPGLSLTSYSIHAASEDVATSKENIKVDDKNLYISTPFWEVKLDASGGITSLVDLKTGKHVFLDKKRNGFFAGVIDGKPSESHGQWVISKTNDSSPSVTAREYGFIADIPYTFELVFRSNTPRIDCSVEFLFDGQKIGQVSNDLRDSVSPFIHEKKLRFKCFPAVSDQARGIRDLPFAISETPNKYIEGNYWTAISDDNNGIAIFNRGTMGTVREADSSLSVPLAYAMYYIWGTRMLKGNYQYHFALYPFTGPWQKADLHRQAIAYNFPVVYTSSDAGDGSFDNRVEMLNIASENILLSAFYIDDSNVVARMYESAGIQTQSSVTSLYGDSKLLEVDLKNERKDFIDDKILFNPWQIRSFIIQQSPGN